MNVRRLVCSCLVLSLIEIVLLRVPARAAVLDPNFTETPWIAAPANPTGLAWAPDGSGRLFVTIKNGTVRIVQSGSPPTLVPTPFATLSPIFTSSECGLIGIAFDPAFVSNHYVYVFVTVSSSEQQIIRYTDVNSIGTNKTLIKGNLPTNGINHDGGGLGFGADGLLYWSIGDNGTGVGVNADLTSLASKVGRAWVEGTIPADNPFNDGPGPNNDFIWVRGVRNPFTLNFQPSTGRLWVDVTGGSYEQVFAPLAGEHCGWNTYENNQPAGFITPLIKYRTNGIDTRTIAAGGASRSGGIATYTTTAIHGFRLGEKITISGVPDATFNGNFYVTGTPTTTTFTVAQAGSNALSGGGSAATQSFGGALTGGAFYDGTGFPAAYRGNFFFGDYNSGNIARAAIGPGTTVNTVDLWSTGLGNSIDIAPGPDGALYSLSSSGQIYRTTYNASSQALVLSDTHVLVHESQAAALSVRLAIAPAGPVSVSVARTSGSTDVTVASGATLTFTPANFATPQTVVLRAADDSDLAADSATITVSSAGLSSETVQVNVVDLSGVSGAGSPGAVPDGASVPGTELTIAKNVTPGNLDLHWGASCSVSATDYEIQEGVLGSWYSHTAIRCSTGGSTSATITQGSGNRYYLIVPLDAAREGSYGTDSSGNERPRPGAHCRSRREAAGCS